MAAVRADVAHLPTVDTSPVLCYRAAIAFIPFNFHLITSPLKIFPQGSLYYVAVPATLLNRCQLNFFDEIGGQVVARLGFLGQYYTSFFLLPGVEGNSITAFFALEALPGSLFAACRGKPHLLFGSAERAFTVILVTALGLLELY